MPRDSLSRAGSLGLTDATSNFATFDGFVADWAAAVTQASTQSSDWRFTTIKRGRTNRAERTLSTIITPAAPLMIAAARMASTYTAACSARSTQTIPRQEPVASDLRWISLV